MNLEDLYRREYGRILASLIRTVRDFTLAEDSLHDAFAAAHVQWPERGIPPNPVAWLMTTARNKAIDQIRHRSMAEHKHNEMITLATYSGARALLSPGQSRFRRNSHGLTIHFAPACSSLDRIRITWSYFRRF